MIHSISIGEIKISNKSEDIVATRELGSSIGITIYDPVTRVGGMANFMLPSSSVSPEKAKTNPFIFVDSGLPFFINSLISHGAEKSRFIVKVAGGANMSTDENLFSIGKRNYHMLLKIFWIHGILIAGQDVGGNISREMLLDIASGNTTVKHRGRTWDI